MTGKDIELLIYGAIAGAVAGLIFAVLIQPLVDEPARRILVAILGARRIRTKRSLAGAWSSVWVKDGSPLSLQYEMKRIDIINVGNSIEGQFDWNRRTYKFSGTRMTDDFVSGTYSDVQEGRVFHGVFQ